MKASVGILVVAACVLAVRAQPAGPGVAGSNVVKMVNATESLGVNRLTANLPDADMTVIRSIIPPCVARLPNYVIGSRIVVGTGCLSATHDRCCVRC